MIQRGRKSATALATVTKLTDRQPLQPPDTLTLEQREIWFETVNNRPVDWFGGEQVQLLVAYCGHMAFAATLRKALRDMRTSDLADMDGLMRHDKLLAMHSRESKAGTMLAVQLRLTNQSRIDKLAAGRESRTYQAAGQGKPWEPVKK